MKLPDVDVWLAAVWASIAGLLVLLAACAPDAPNDASSHRFTLTVEDGVEVALTTGGPKYDGDIFAYEKVLTIRPDPAAPESYLGPPGAMTMSEDGTIFVADGRAGRVVAFSSDGAFLRTYGRRGQGPGEFRFPALLEVIDDALWAQDLSGQRTHVFSLDGSFLRTVGIPGPPRGLIDGYWWFLADGRIVIYEVGMLRDEEHTYQRAEMRVMDAEGNVLASRETPWLPATERFQPADRSEAVTLELQFRGFSEGRYARQHGFFLMSADQPEVRVYDLDGDLTRILRIDLPPRPVTDEDRATALARLEDELQRALNPDESSSYRPDPRPARIQRDNPRYVDPKDYWRGMFVDDKGFVWLMPLPDHGGFQSGPSWSWLVLSAEGEYLGRTLAPGSRFHRGHVLASEEDPDSGEQFPVVYRIRPAVPGLEY